MRLNSTPKWFRKSLEKVKRAKDRRETRRVNRTGDYWNYSYSLRKNDALWEWW